MIATPAFIPTPVFFGDAQHSTMAVMLFPDDLAKARNFAAQLLNDGTLRAYIAAGHDFSDRWMAFADAMREGRTSDKEIAARLAGAKLALDATKALWGLVCSHSGQAGWSGAIELVGEAYAKEKVSSSPSHIRKQLRLFAPVLHLWLAWALDDRTLPPAADLFRVGYGLLFKLRKWELSRDEAFRRDDGYLAERGKYGPWPALAMLMEAEGGQTVPLVSLVSRSTK